MILCDIGNTHFHFNKDGIIFDEKICSLKNEKIYFISVNEKKKKELLKKNPKSIDLENYAFFDTSYKNLGIDRIMACRAIEDGVVVDAGSAITVDVMSANIHLGGYILPGIYHLNETYKKISPKLKYDFKFQIDFNLLPANTQEAISYGAIGMIISFIEKVAKNKRVYFTGGDGAYLQPFFENSIYIKDLVFRGMKNVIENEINNTKLLRS